MKARNLTIVLINVLEACIKDRLHGDCQLFVGKLTHVHIGDRI